MKLSEQTIAILKNFAGINSNLVIHPGKKIKTISVASDILAEYEGGDEFDKTISIFNLSEFLNVYAAFSSPEIELDDKYLTVKQGKQKARYVYADEHLMIAPRKDFAMPSVDVSVELPQELLVKIQKMSAVLGVEDISIIGNGEKIYAKVWDKTDGSAEVTSFEFDLDDSSDKIFQINFKNEKLRLFQSNYKVEISNQKVSKWTATDLSLVVYIAVESDSTFK